MLLFLWETLIFAPWILSSFAVDFGRNAGWFICQLFRQRIAHGTFCRQLCPQCLCFRFFQSSCPWFVTVIKRPLPTAIFSNMPNYSKSIGWIVHILAPQDMRLQKKEQNSHNLSNYFSTFFHVPLHRWFIRCRISPFLFTFWWSNWNRLFSGLISEM